MKVTAALRSILIAGSENKEHIRAPKLGRHFVLLPPAISATGFTGTFCVAMCVFRIERTMHFPSQHFGDFDGDGERRTTSKACQNEKSRPVAAAESQTPGTATETACNNNNNNNSMKGKDDDMGAGNGDYNDDEVSRCSSSSSSSSSGGQHGVRRHPITGKDAEGGQAAGWSALAGAAWKNDDVHEEDDSAAASVGEVQTRDDVGGRQRENPGRVDDRIGCGCCWNDAAYATNEVWSLFAVHSRRSDTLKQHL